MSVSVTLILHMLDLLIVSHAAFTCCIFFSLFTACAQIVLLSFKYQQFNFTFLEVSFFSNQLVPFYCMLIVIIISFSFDISHTDILYSVSDSNIYGPYGGV